MRSHVVHPLLATLSLLLSGALAACDPGESASTGAVVRIRAESAVTAQTASIEIRVYGSDGLTPNAGMVLREQRTVAFGSGGRSFPYTVGITPLDGEDTRLYRIEVDARGAGGTVIASARAISGYMRGRVLSLDLVLEDLCLGVPPCSDLGQTCRASTCVDAHVDPSTLPDYRSDAGATSPVDGGNDAGAEAGVDAGADAAMDAGVDADAGATTDAGVDAAMDAGIDAGFDAGVDCGPIPLLGGATSPVYTSGTTEGSIATFSCPTGTERRYLGAAVCRGVAGWSHPADCAAVTVTADSVTFERTGLQWSRTNASSGNQSAAFSHCSSLVLDGQSDWRVPTVAEFLTTVSYDRGAPSFDPIWFPDRQSGLSFWTNTSGPPASGTAWWVGQDGSASYDAYTLIKAAHCVRTVTTIVPSRTDNGNGTVTDAVTGLVWQKGVSAGGLDQAGAAAYCASLDLGGVPIGTWRVPRIDELVTLTLYNGTPAISTTLFSGTPSACCTANVWSASPRVGDPSAGWVVNYYEGYVSNALTSSAAPVRCVY